MTSLFATDVRATPPDRNTYQPGVCNIGPMEIARRRMVGHVGLAATIATLGSLTLIDAPPILRLAAAVPAMVSASGYLQARLRFCAGYGRLGMFNFGESRAHAATVADSEARAADRRKAWQISAWSALIGLGVGVAGWLLPL
jgi:hypothetical protein